MSARHATTWYIGLAVIAAFAASSFVSDLLYEQVIVPRLSSVRSVPMWWWGAASLPIVIATFAMGWMVLSARVFVLWSLSAAVGINLYIAWASLAGRPGFVNQPSALTDPIAFWTFGLGAVAVMVGIVVAIGLAMRTGLFERRPPNLTPRRGR